MKLDRVQILQREIKDQVVTLQEVSSRLGDKVSLRSDKEERKVLHQQWTEEQKGPLLNPCHPDVILVGGLPKGIVDAITLLEARALQRNRQQLVKAGTPHIASWHCWKKLLYSRIRIRTHILKKDIERREIKAAAIAAGEMETRDTARPSDKNENQDFCHA